MITATRVTATCIDCAWSRDLLIDEAGAAVIAYHREAAQHADELRHGTAVTIVSIYDGSRDGT